ncbi:MAG TPA: hypothetical protein PLR06_05630 [Cyclobacteriaceae bacterium]|nr:hypothetical protein [Cyclobacteriaceae bacterium]
MALTVSFTVAQAQSAEPNSLGPGKKKVFYAPAAAHIKAKPVNIKHTARYEFYKRVEKVAKEKQWALKKLSKMQYSDRRHFGHKRIPLRKSPNKMRYCNECGIRH